MGVGHVAFTPNGKHLFLTDDDDGWAYLMDVRTWEVKQILQDQDPPGVLIFSHDGRRCVRYGWHAETDAPTLEWWKYPSWKLYRTWDIFSDEEERFAVLVLSPDDRTLAGMNPQGVHLYDVATGKRRAHLPFKPSRARSSFLSLLLFHPDGKRLAVGCGKQMTILEIDTMKEVELAKKPFLGGAFTPDGRSLLAASNEESVTVWDTTTGTKTAEHAWDIGPVLSVAVAPDGMTAAAGGKGGQVVVWDLDC
jgi:WD40 repeat protein